MRRSAPLALLPLAAALFSVVPAHAETPLSNARYDGRNASGDRVFLRVRADGARLASYDFMATMTCSDGKKRVLGLNSHNEPPVFIQPNGTFSEVEKPATFSYFEHGKRLTGKARTDFTGSFTQKDVATGTVTSTFTAKKVSCSSPAEPWTAHLDGSAAAPFRNDLMATGRYRASGRGIAFSKLATLAPGGVLAKADFKFSVPCRYGRRPYGYRSSFLPLYFGFPAEDKINLPEARTIKSEGFVGRERYRLKFHFFKRAGVYRVSGSYAMRVVIRRRGKFVNSCSGTRSFSGRFVSGPANLF